MAVLAETLTETGTFKVGITIDLGPSTLAFLNQLTLGMGSKLDTILANQEKLMSQLSDAVDAVQAALDKLATDNAQAFTDLEAAIAAAGANSPDVQAAVAKLGTINTALQNLDAAALAADATTKT